MGFAHEMLWEHQNAILHNTQLEASQLMRDADAITKLYDKVDTYSAEDW
jgi:hypothetical protein